MLRKILTIAWKEVYLTFTDRNLLLIMIIAPLAISAIVGLAFGGAGGGNVAIGNIPVAIVNLDTGAEQQGQALNYGAMFTSMLIPSATEGDPSDSEANAFGGDCPLVENEPEATGGENTAGVSLDSLFNAVELTDIDAARAAVESGEYAALIIIPADFSDRLSPAISFGETADSEPPAPTTVEIYANEGMPVSASIVRSVVEGFTDRIVGGNIAIAASINTLIATNPLAALALGTDSEATAVFACAFSGALNTVTIDRQALAAETGADAGPNFTQTTMILVQVGTAQAAFFALFTGQFGVLGIIEERKTGTLQRMVVSPTPRAAILAGNLLGTFVTVVFQISLLLLSLTLIASLIEGELAMIFGTNLLAIVALVLVLSLTVSALGVLIAGIARTSEQANAIGTVFNLVTGMLGGTFGFAIGAPLCYLSIIFWGRDGFNQLSMGRPDIGLNLLVLALLGVVLYLIGLFMFNRRLDI